MIIDALNEMSVYDLCGRIAIVFVAVSAFIQISPIKFNPWSWIGKRIGRGINGELMESLKGIRTEVDDIRSDMSRDRAENQRTKIIRFGSEIRLRQKHTKDYFDEIMNDITEYELYCEQNPDFRNNITEATSQIIKETYKRCLEENSFL